METYQLQHLTGRRLRVFLAAADRIIPSDDVSHSGGSLETAAIVDWTLARMDPDMRKLFLTFLVAVEVLGVFFGGRPFTRNSASVQDRQLRWLESAPISKIRLGFFGLKNYACMGYYTREDVWADIGYGGPHVPDRASPDATIRLLQQTKLRVHE